MDALAKDDVSRARNTSPATKLLQALELMELGVQLRIASLRERYRLETERQRAERLRSWLRDAG